jgi:hypothetical protein
MAMTRRITLAILLAGALLPAPALAEDAYALDAHTRLGTPISHEHLTLVPILASQVVKDDREYLTLDEAFDKKLVKVREMDNESVNSLSLENLSDRPLFVMSGEVIIGGKQDRVIGKERLIQPKTAAIVEVFCVEHGRWSEEKGSRTFRSARTLAHTKLRLSASYDAQADVWNEVAAKNTKRKTNNDTDTYRAVTGDKKVEKAIAPYREKIGQALAALPEKDRLIGFVVAINGEIVGVESFGSPRLFAKLSDKILRSYLVEAIDHGKTKVGTAPLGAKEVKLFLAAGAEAKEKEVAKDGKAVTRQKQSAGAAETSLDDEKPAAAQPSLYRGKYKR